MPMIQAEQYQTVPHYNLQSRQTDSEALFDKYRNHEPSTCRAPSTGKSVEAGGQNIPEVEEPAANSKEIIDYNPLECRFSETDLLAVFERIFAADTFDSADQFARPSDDRSDQNTCRVLRDLGSRMPMSCISGAEGRAEQSQSTTDCSRR
jgi:hypothetical protein